MTTGIVPPGWLTERQAAEKMGCSPRYVSRLTYLGKLNPTIIGEAGGARIRLYSAEEIQRYINEHPRLGRYVGQRALATA